MIRQVASLLGDERVEARVAAPKSVLEHPAFRARTGVRLSPRSTPISQLRDAAVVARAARVGRIDCLHGHGLVRFPTVAIGARLARRRWVATLHNLLPLELDPMRRTALGILLGSAARILAVSEAVAASVAGIAKSHLIDVVRNGIDPTPYFEAPSREEARDLLGWSPEPAIVLAVARLAPEKGLDLLAPLVKARSVRVVVAGEGPERTRLEPLGLELLGNREDIPVLLAASDVVVVPSRSEGLGLAAIEALAMGRPVVATAVGGLPEVVDARVGALVSPESDAIAEAVHRLLADPEQRAQLGSAGRARVLARFDIEAMRASTREAYRKALGCD